ncbi:MULTISPECIES: hypothetical protein [unclassified Clostridium]|uniref:hypothetical protein n=1 Tax=unclassified Clostridium TaxID=2614128 RepID=UPI003217DA7C
MYYKPVTVEENIANIVWMKNNIYGLVNSYVNQFNSMTLIYSNSYYYNNAIAMGIINYNSNYELEVTKIAYSIFGFSNDLYHRISYALDCWNRISTKSKNGASFKNYDQVVKIIKNKNIIDGSEKEALLDFRKKRNFTTHYGKIIFIRYIFNNYNLLYNLLVTIENLLIKQSNIDDFSYCNYLEQQSDFIEDLKETLNEFSFGNNLAS